MRLYLVMMCLAVMACDSKSNVGSSDGTQVVGGDSAQTNAGSVSHAAEGGSHAGTPAAAGGRSGSASTASNDADAGPGDEPTAGSGKAGAGGKSGTAPQGGSASQGGNTSQGGKGGHAGRAGQAGKSGHTGQGGAGSGGAGSGGAGSGGAGSGGAAAAAAGGSAGMGPSAGRCGTRGSAMCGAAEFCNFEPDQDCGGTDRGGRCQAKPGDCDDTSEPVCGCDNHSYDNACEAHRAGVSVQREGLCGSEECDAAGGVIVTSDGASTPMCPANEPSFPIRGGREATLCCLPPDRSGKTCGGIGSLECDGSDFCNYEKDAGGQGCDGRIADAAGVCQPKPSVCTREYRAVCGCDHHSYGNACEAHSNGAAVLHEGECSEAECAAVGGRVEVGSGPGPMCDADETSFGPVAPAGSQIPIEGQICCVPKP